MGLLTMEKKLYLIRGVFTIHSSVAEVLRRYADIVSAAEMRFICAVGAL